MENWYDIAVIVSIILSTFVGIFRGFIKESLTLFVWIGGLYLTFNLAPIVGQFVPGINTEVIRNIVAGFIMFLSLVTTGTYFGTIVSKAVRASGMGITDRSLGAAIGLTRAGVLALLLTAWLATTSFSENSTWKGSLLVPQLKKLNKNFSTTMPESWREKLKHFSNLLHF